MMTNRLDTYLVAHRFFKSREKAQRAIRENLVKIDGLTVRKPSFLVVDGVIIDIQPFDIEYVGQGGIKLHKAIKEFKIELHGKSCMDIGASTGGFCDCMIKHGAAKVYAVDVGSGQLDESLLRDERIVNLEKTDVRKLDVSNYANLDFISVDVSFISLKLILPSICALMGEKTSAIVLIKPQFEAGQKHIAKGGIVKESKVHVEVIFGILEFLDSVGLIANGLTFSPISKGNIEYLLYLSKKATSDVLIDKKTALATVEQARLHFK